MMQAQTIISLVTNLQNTFESIRKETGAFDMCFNLITRQIEIHLFETDFDKLCAELGAVPHFQNRLGSDEFPYKKFICVNNVQFYALSAGAPDLERKSA
ncbi:MAG: hypothetical protein ACPLRU_00220 [Desulfofundulus sp.]